MLLVHDPLHSQLEFKIKHLMISQVRGVFKQFDAKIETKDATFKNALVMCVVEVGSIHTQIKDRDDHLRSSDFFDVEKFPQMTFLSTKTTQLSSSKYILHGYLEIKGEKRSMELVAEYNGSDVDQYGQLKYGFELTGTIRRSEWGLDFNVPGGNSTLLIGDEVKIEADIQMIEKK